MLVDWHASAWSKRGWTFQEEKLSTRLVYFGFSKIHFCCGNRIYTHPTGVEIYEKSIMDIGRETLRENGVQQLTDFWTNNLVPQFCLREFTKPVDKLPAIAGVAKYIGDITGYDYVAGLWKSRLETELIWCCDPFEGQIADLCARLQPDASNYIAPSWSWARFFCANFVDFFFSEEKQRYMKLEAEFDGSVTRAGPNVYGRVLSAELTMTTKILPVTPRYCHIYRAEHSYSVDSQMNSHSVLCILDWSSEGGLNPVQQTRLALVGSYSIHEWTQKRYYGIIVYPSASSGKYYRVGIFDSPFFDRHDLNFESAEVRDIVVI
jgi:hypothetical protein